jgi:zinc D-Ala-D-Ala dipeptidase
VPRFEIPRTTERPANVLAKLQITLAELGVEPQPPLPELTDPEKPRVTSPSNEPLAPIVHRKIRVLSNYFHAGWEHASIDMRLRDSALQRLIAVAEALPPRLGLAVFDAYRPLALQAELYDAAYGDSRLPPGFVSEPVADPTTPPPHLTGGTVDLSLTIDGIPLALGTDFDGFTAEAETVSLEASPGPERELRRFLVHRMRAEGFVALHCEWWHFEYGTRRWAAIKGVSPIYGPAPTHSVL